MANQDKLANPFGPGGAYSGGASFVARGADLRSPQATQERKLKNLEMAIYSAAQQLNQARQALKLEPVRLHLSVAEAGEQVPNQLAYYHGRKFEVRERKGAAGD